MIDDNSFRELLHTARIKFYNFPVQRFVAKSLRIVYTVGIE